MIKFSSDETLPTILKEEKRRGTEHPLASKKSRGKGEAGKNGRL